jgi:hypothetical protein
MLCTCPSVIALSAMAAALTTAQSADVLTLACEGTAKETQGNAKPQPISMGVIIDFTAGTIVGFADCPVEIEAADGLVVTFSCSYNTEISVMYLVGRIDRVTGDAEATSMVWRKEMGILVSETIYALKCRPAQRMF